MPNSQQQSLDEDAVFLPVTESSPEFLYCEKERQAVESLLSAGPEAFYSSIDTEHSGCFLSSEEVSQISSWAQDYHFNRLQVKREAHGGSETEDLCSTYFPSYSDTPTPDLELGWPEKSPWGPKASATVHTSPPAEGERPVREIIRRHLQKACQVIAVVTDSLTDGAIIADLHNAASRGVPVYIILNQRSIQENFTLNRLRHPYMRVRVLGGKTLCSRTGRMVVGEMKDKFLLVDLETVIHGSYSLTWTDAHLHRQLITVLSGPVVDSFDREFRVLFAASSLVPVTWRAAGPQIEQTHHLKDSNLRFQKHLPLEPEITGPPSPPADSLLDWEAMGVLHRDPGLPDSPLVRHEQIVGKEMPLQNNTLFDRNTSIVDNFIHNGNQFADKRRLIEQTSPLTNSLPDRSTAFKVEGIIERARSKQLSTERSSNLNDRTRFDDKATEPTHNTFSSLRRQRSRTEHILEEEQIINETSPKVENSPSSRKPLILRVPQSENFSSLSDIMKRLQPQQKSSGLPKRGSKAAVSELSQSMMNLSVHNKETNDVPVPRFRASYLDPEQMTPSFALMRKRNEDLKPLLYRTPVNFLPRERPRSSSYALGMDWRRSLAEMERDQDTGAKK